MKLLKTKNEISEDRNVTGLLACTVKHEIKSSTASLRYEGPYLPKEEWQRILSFFKWTYDTTHSESQVRLYVNMKLQTWKAWAYPQKARTGMSATELETEEAKRQRAQFKDSDGWIYFGTVHHHCAMGAFQSGTDESNEKAQDGLHITVGKLDEKHYDLHCRFYRGGLQFEPDLDEFWDVGAPWNVAPDEWVDKSGIARWQMGEPAEVDFPKEWKDNLIEVKTETPSGVGFQRNYGHWADREDHWPGLYNPQMAKIWDQEKREWREAKGAPEKSDPRQDVPVATRVDRAIQSLSARMDIGNYSLDELVELLEVMDDQLAEWVVETMQRYQVDAGDLLGECRLIEQRELQKELQAAAGDPGDDIDTRIGGV